MRVLVCVKRVPQTGGRIVLTPDGQAIDTKFLGFTISPHEECGCRRSGPDHRGEGRGVRGPHPGAHGRRGAAPGRHGAQGIDRAVLLETDGSEWDPVSTAAAIADAIRAQRRRAGRSIS